MNADMSVYFSGKRLYGDDFGQEQIEAWFRDEEEGYANLGAKEQSHYRYVYHELNRRHGFRHLPGSRMARALGIGSAYGEEFAPVARCIDEITILDPSDAFSSVTQIHGSPCRYVKPAASGDMPFPDLTFDLITSLGVLHHIPNVSHVMRECARCLREGGFMLIREPIVSMGDWTKPRPGLTRHERGIPIDIFADIIKRSGLKVVSEAPCMFPVVPRLAGKFGTTAYSDKNLTLLDAILSRMFCWNRKYHRVRLFEKFGPASIYYVLTK
jgi:SAM-dependent methyltransferase